MRQHRFFPTAAALACSLIAMPGIAASPSDFDTSLIPDVELTRTYTQLIVVSRITPDVVLRSLAPCRRASATQSLLADATVARWKLRNDDDMADVNSLASALAERMTKADAGNAAQVFRLIDDMTTGASAERLKLKIVMSAWDSLPNVSDESCALRNFALDQGKMDIRTNQSAVWDIVQRAKKR